MPFYQKNLNAKSIFVIAPKKIESEIKKIPGTLFIDEDTVYPELSYKSVSDIFCNICGDSSKTGWYLQQFLKLAWAYHCDDKYYVVIDADTFPLNPVPFIDENGKYLFTKKIEYNKPYFDTIKKLFNGEIKREGNFSFISENMIFDCDYVKEMLNKIENNCQLQGNNFFEKIIYAINPCDVLQSGFSEFETYGNYMLATHPDRCAMRTLRTQREAVYILGSCPTSQQFLWAAKDYDIISIEVPTYKSTIMTLLAKRKFIQIRIRFRTLVSLRARTRTIYRKIIGKNDFRFE